MEYREIKKNFNLIRNILKQNENLKNKESLDKIEKIINEKLPQTVKKTAPINFQEIYFDFKYEYEKFKEFILYEKLIGKNIVALGGGFSSGKSSFLNSILNKRVLPSDIDPSTSVPTYIVNDNEEEIYGINIFESKIDLELKDLKSISHGFGEILDDDDNIEIEEVKLGHIVNSVFLCTPNQVYNHIAFLDTPGYSKADTSGYSLKTDEKIARAQLNSSNFILWFIQADDGTIREDDIEFLNSINKEIPKLIIVNKADKLVESSVEDVKSKVREVLDSKGILYVDVVSYSARKSKDYDSDKLNKYLQNWDRQVYESRFARNFKVLFVKCKNYYEELIMEENKRLNRLNTALTMSDNDIVGECLISLINEIKRKVAELKEDENKLKNLQDEFFTEIKDIADKVGIEMPEPSEIDLIQDKIKNPIDVVKEYKKKNGIKSNYNLSVAIMDAMIGVNSVINKQSGGSEYKKELLSMIGDSMVGVNPIINKQSGGSEYKNELLSMIKELM
jgi:signal recognition particle receptor subunit beta